MSNPYFSFIVPVYKVEKYLPQCIKSILSQSFADFEIILVDDGSPDSCPALCDQYSDSDPRIRVIHKKNGGLSSARNAAMPLAQGKYIIFLDSDDYWLSSEALSSLHGHISAECPDIVVLKHLCYYESTSTLNKCNCTFSSVDFLSSDYDQRLLQLVSMQLFDTCAWNKVFKRSLLDNTDLSFCEGIISEDLDWAARLCLSAQSISILPEYVHVYRKGRPGSITSSIKLKNLLDTKGSIMRCLEYPAVQTRSKTFCRAYYSYLAYRYVIWLAESSVVNAPEVKKLFEEMTQLRWLLKYDANRKVRLAKIACRLLGLKHTSKLLGRYLSAKH